VANCCHVYPAHAAFGGYKQSGFDRDITMDVAEKGGDSFSLAAADGARFFVSSCPLRDRPRETP
jgi:hypothetical protein